jgi:hypothetical protein
MMFPSDMQIYRSTHLKLREAPEAPSDVLNRLHVQRQGVQDPVHLGCEIVGMPGDGAILSGGAL